MQKWYAFLEFEPVHAVHSHRSQLLYSTVDLILAFRPHILLNRIPIFFHLFL